jgi:hypothetical protein
MNPPDPDDVGELLRTERTLTPEEQSTLARISTAGWKGIQAVLNGRSKAAYSVAAEEDFARCVFGHMLASERDTMIGADLYTCPVCERLLKDRKTPVASSILLERARVRELWLDVEKATTPDEIAEAAERFRRALGLPGQP